VHETAARTVRPSIEPEAIRTDMNQQHSAADGIGDDDLPGEVGNGGRNVTSIERATDVLFLFTRSASPTLGVTEIATELGISKAVVHRILASLCERDLVIADAETRRYSLGPAVLQLATAFRERLDVRPLALSTMQALSAASEETATLSIRHGWQRIYVDQVTPNREVKMTVPVGRQFALHAGSSSKAFLAFLPPEEIEQYLREAPLTAATAETITSASALRDDLAAIRSRGYAVSLGERQAGAGSVAAPVFDADGPVAVISLCGPLERFRDRIPEFAALVTDATATLSTRLGSPYQRFAPSKVTPGPG
jgi:IclR family transcriptional regulator, acetate operon repressor